MSRIRLRGMLSFPPVHPSAEVVVIDESNFREWQNLLMSCGYKSWVTYGSYDYFRKRYYIWIGVNVGGELAGTCAVEFKDKKVLIAAVGVLPKYGRRGIGTYMVWVVKEALHIRGHKKVFVDVQRENQPAVAICKKAGFQ